MFAMVRSIAIRIAARFSRTITEAVYGAAAMGRHWRLNRDSTMTSRSAFLAVLVTYAVVSPALGQGFEPLAPGAGPPAVSQAGAAAAGQQASDVPLDQGTSP